MIGKWHQKVDRDGRVHQILGLCDRSLLGKTLREGEAVLDLSKYRSFYEGENVSTDQAEEWIKLARNANLVGPKVIECAKKAIPGCQKSIRTVAGVPHLHIYFL